MHHSCAAPESKITVSWANIYFAVLEIAGALVNVQDGPGRVHLCVYKPEAARSRASSKQALARTENNGKLPDT